ADFGGEWIMFPITSRVHPQDQTCRTGGRENVQHCQNGRCSNSRTEQHDWALAGLQNETSAWRTDIENVAHADMVPHIGSTGPIRLNLYTDSITQCRRLVRKRVTAKKWPSVCVRLNT